MNAPTSRMAASITERDARIEELEAENADLREQVAALQGDNDVLVFAVAQCREVARLKAILAERDV